MRQIGLLTIALHHEHDVVTARQRAREVAQRLGFDAQDQTRIATAVSELARNAFMYAGAGRIEFVLEHGTPSQILMMRISDSGPGIPDLDRVLNGEYHSPTGMGIGMLGAKKLMDSFRVDSEVGSGTTVTIRKARPAALPALAVPELKAVTDELVHLRARTPIEELRQQNQELLTALEALERNQQELLRLNEELEDTNRGVVALYAELDENAKELHRANQTKSRFLAHMSHEFRTPLNSVLALSRLLLDHADGELSEEQTKQVVFIRRAAGELLEMVNDLLDLAKVEAGTMTVHPSELDVEDLLSTLRGMFLPLVGASTVALVFESANRIPKLWVDERKVTQILRNFIANALRFTSQGEIRVAAALSDGEERVTFSVKDTGIGIAEEDQETIFEEFRQVSGMMQHKSLGSGLGLAISRKLAELLGGTVAVESRPGEGSTFYLTIPVVRPEGSTDPTDDSLRFLANKTVLVVDDNEVDRYVLADLLAASRVQVLEARGGDEGIARAEQEKPSAVFVDLMMPDMNGFEVLERLRSSPATSGIPVVLITSKSLDASERELVRRHRISLLPKGAYSNEDAAARVRTALVEALQVQGGEARNHE